MLGTAYVQIEPQAKGIKGAISNVLGGEAESAGVSIGGKIGAFAKKAIIAAGIGTVVVKTAKAALAQGAELEQNIGGAYAVFGDKLYGTLEKQAQGAYKNMGMSASDYYATANKMGSLFQGSGLSQQKSLDLYHECDAESCGCRVRNGTRYECGNGVHRGCRKRQLHDDGQSRCCNERNHARSVCARRD